MRNITPASFLRLKMNSSTSASSPKTSPNQNNPSFKPSQKQHTQNPPAKTASTKEQKSLRNSLLVISSVCKGIILCPGMRNLNSFISKFKRHPILRYRDDLYPGQAPSEGKQTPAERTEHDKILAEQQTQLEKLKKEIKERESVEKFPKYKPK